MAATLEAVKISKDQQKVLEVLNELLLGKAPGQKGEPSPGLLQFIPGLAAMPGAAKSVQRGYRQFRRQLVAEPGSRFLTELPENLAGVVNKLLTGPMFHGGKRSSRILEEGFDPARVGQQYGLRFGEPSGASLTLNPLAATGFGTPLRVAPVIRPRDIAPVFTDKAKEAILESYQHSRRSVGTDPNIALRSGDVVMGGTQESDYYRKFIDSAREMLSKEKSNLSTNDLLALLRDARMKAAIEHRKFYGGDVLEPPFYNALNAILNPKLIRQFNDAMSSRLRQAHEIEALLYNPNRYREFELRVLDPRKIVPLEWRGGQTTQEANIPSRYSSLKDKVLQEFLQSLKGAPESLSDYYKKLPE